MDSLSIFEQRISENPQNEHLRGNLQIDQPNEIQILKFICQWKAKNQTNLTSPKLSNSDLSIKINWPQKSTFDFWWKMNVKLEGQMNSEFDEFAIDVSFSCVVKTQRWSSKKIYKTELTKTRYNNQVLGKYRVNPQRAGLTLIAELTWSNLGLKKVLNKRK